MHALFERATGFLPDLVSLRRELHRNPELSFREHRTAELLALRVGALGFRVKTGVGGTGIVAELGTDGPIVALRADMDALPIQETNDVEYRSAVSGVMHACGHDAHMAMLTGAARLLSETKFRGTVRLLFQPSEEASDSENKSGAVRMIEDGAMKDVAGVFGLHIGAHLESGKAFIRGGPYMAGSDVFTARVLGKASHAARPEEGIDAIVLAAHAVLACQNAVARRLSPLKRGVLTIGRVRGGTAENIIADEVALHGTVRYFEEDVRQILHAELKAALEVVRALGGRYDLDLRFGYPPVVNHPKLTELAGDVAQTVLGDGALAKYEPMMGAEDFSFLAREAPGCFFWLGAALSPAREHHHPNFDIDESALPKGAALLAGCALEFLNRS